MRSRRRCSNAAEAVQQLEAEHAERTQRGYAIDGEVAREPRAHSQIALEIDRAQARRRHNEERCAELVARPASSEAELAQARSRLTALEAERESNRQILESAAADLAAAQQRAGALPAGSCRRDREPRRNWSASRSESRRRHLG